MYTALQLQLLRNALPSGTLLPGIDTPVGCPASTVLTPIASAPASPDYAYNASNNTCSLSTPNAVISGIDFGNTGVLVNATGVTIENCIFANPGGYYGVTNNAPGTIIQNCTFTGPSVGGPGIVQSSITSQVAVNVKACSFINTAMHAVGPNAGSVVGCFFQGCGMQTGAHADAIDCEGSSGPLLIQGNFIDWTLTPGAMVGGNEAIRACVNAAETTAIYDVTITGNYIIGADYTICCPGSPAGIIAPAAGSYSNVVITGNYIGFPFSGYQMNPGTGTGVTFEGNITCDWSNQTYSTAGWAAYLAALPVGTPVNYAAPGGGYGNTNHGYVAGQSVVIYGGTPGEALWGTYSASNVNFVGGFGCQVMHLGAGASTLTYLAISDSLPSGPDQVSLGAGPVVFDFSHLSTAVPGTPLPPVQTLNAPAGALVCVGAGPSVVSPAGGETVTITPAWPAWVFGGLAPAAPGQITLSQSGGYTYVNATLLGSTAPDLSVRVGGLQAFTAANFIL